MPHGDWNAAYAEGDLPWDEGRPDEALVEAVDAGALPVGSILEVGCGTGTNALWLASRGFDVLGIDVSPLAVERCRARLAETPAGRCRFDTLDFLDHPPPGGPFDLAFDRGCFHVFDDAAARARFAARVAAVLAPGGIWLSLIGSTEGGPRDTGPPRRSAREVIAAIEPILEVLELRAIVFERHSDTPAPAWLCRSRVRTHPAQPSTGGR